MMEEIPVEVVSADNFTDEYSQTARRECELLSLNDSLPLNWCPRDFDYVLCWPPTAPSTDAQLPCFGELRGIKYDTSNNASRWCDEAGVWANYSNYSRCTEFVPEEVTPQDNDDISVITSIIYFSGYVFSTLALLCAVTIFIYYKDLRCLRNTVHTNLMFSYILNCLTYILYYVLYIWLHVNDCVSHALVMVLLHYFQATIFFWMFVEGLYLYMLVVETFRRETINLWGYVIIGWGLPAAIIAVWAATSYALDSSDLNDFNRCGREAAGGLVVGSSVDWVFKAPTVLVLALNAVILIRIMWVLITKLRSSNSVETHQNWKATKALLVLMPLLGVNYVLLLLGPVEKKGLHVLMYEAIRAFLFSTQGFTVALFYCFLNTEVRNTLRHHFQRWKEARQIPSRYKITKGWSTNERAESLRLYPGGERPKGWGRKKRHSSVSEATTMTVVGPSRVSNGSVGRQDT